MKSGLSSLLTVFLLLAIASPAGAKEGFGSAKESVRLQRIVPPAVALGADSFAVRTVGAEAGAPWSRRLEAVLEKELAARDGAMVADLSQPAVVIELTVLRNQLTDTWETRMDRERRQIGVGAENRNVYQTVEVQVRYLVIVRDVAVSFEVIQAATGKVLDSGSIAAPFEGRFRDGDKAPALESVQAEGIAKVADGIATRITPGREAIEVLLPKGRLEEFAALAGAGKWDRYRDAVAALAPSPEGSDEAYRQYALATANEALGYAAADPAARREHLELAESQYAAAIAANPGEKLFAKKSGAAAPAAPLERVRATLASFERSEAVRPPAVAAPTVAAGNPRPAPVDGAMDNAAIIRMVREGKGGYAIMMAMKAAPGVAFDLSPEGLAELSEANVDPKIIGYMQQFSDQN